MKRQLRCGDEVVASKHVDMDPMPERPFKIFDIEKCKDKDKECPKDCPGMISLDAKEFKCYAYMNSTWDQWVMGLIRS